MRAVILKDSKIKKGEYEKFIKDYSDYHKELYNITPGFDTIEKDYSTYPTYKDSDGDMRPTEAYLQDLSDEITAKYDKYGVDYIIVLIHQDNWLSPTIWGTNYSYVFSSHCLEYCRWDKRNVANTIGTVHHELRHSDDAVVETEAGVDINFFLGLTNWDRQVVHGQHPDYKYMRYKDNEDAMRAIAPHLRRAWATRESKHNEVVRGLWQTAYKLALEVLRLTRLVVKNGIQ